VSLPAIQRYIDRLNAGEQAPPIKMDGNVIVDGNHRYIAGGAYVSCYSGAENVEAALTKR